MHGKFDELGRFADPSVLILTSLSDGPKHGYAIMTDVAGFSGVAMEPGTLYGALSRLEKRGWIRPLENEERLREIAFQGRQRVLENYSFSAQRECYLALFDRLLPARRRKSTAKFFTSEPTCEH